jgi:hypothetical protein
MATSRQLRRNPPPTSEAGWVVQKYGGTSVGKFLGVIGQQIVPYVPYRPSQRRMLTEGIFLQILP